MEGSLTVFILWRQQNLQFKIRWLNLKVKICIANPVDGVQTAEFMVNLDRTRTVLMSYGGLANSFYPLASAKFTKFQFYPLKPFKLQWDLVSSKVAQIEFN